MKPLTLTSLLLVPFLVITTHAHGMNGEGPIGQRLLAKLVIDGGVPAGHPDACTQRDCAEGTAACIASITLGGIIAFPVCATLGVPFGIPCVITLASGLPGMLLWACCCRKTRNSQETL
jgi:hypothetical protein